MFASTNAKISRSKKVDDKIISNKLVYKSFWTKGINNNLDSKEDYSFSSLKKMNNELPKIENNLDKDYEYSINLNEEKILD